MRTPRSVALSPLLLLLACGSESSSNPESYDVLDLVDARIGTGGGGFAQGNAFIGPTLPFGMVKPGPDTQGPLLGASGFAHAAGYWFEDDTIDGFSQLHFHGTGSEDYGNVLLMPIDGIGPAKTKESGYQQKFRHETEEISPGYYAVTLDDTGVRAELTASDHASHHRYTFGESVAEPAMVLDLGHGLGRTGALESNISVEPDGTVSGAMLSAGRFTSEDRAFWVHFVARFDPQPEEIVLFVDGSLLDSTETSTSGTRVGLFARFSAPASTVEARFGMSFIDLDEARNNLAEIDGRTFDQTHEAARDEWRSLLQRIEVTGGSLEEKTMFYTGLYHAFLMPSSMTEASGRYMGLDRKVHQADGFTYYTNLSMWDTYRTLHPLLNLVAPEIGRNVAITLTKMAEQHGRLPRWPLAVNDTGSMLGSPASIILADTYLKGITDFDTTAAYEAMLADAHRVEGKTIRPNCLDTGYCAADRMNGSVSNTLELGWADFAIANMAEALGENADADDFLDRTQSYRMLWDPDAQFLRCKNADGAWGEDSFDPTRMTECYTEGNAWQYVWEVPFDVEGLAELFGGTDRMLQKLDELFDLSVQNPAATIVGPIVGPDMYYWHGNEPDIHAAYLYAMLGEPVRGAKWIEWVRANKYSEKPDGLAGNDDAGTLSSWYVFSALGLYPLAGSDEYILGGTPVFDSATIHLPASALTIEGRGKAERVLIDGAPQNTPFVDHETLLSASTIRFE